VKAHDLAGERLGCGGRDRCEHDDGGKETHG
jgi:hypothetical protein